MTLLSPVSKKDSPLGLDSDQLLRRHLYSLLFIRVCLFTTLIGLSLVFSTAGHLVIMPHYTVVASFLFLVTAYSVCSAIILQKKKAEESLLKTGFLQLFSDTLFIAVLVYASGCSQSIFTPVFVLPIIAGRLILYQTGGLMPAAAATLSFGIILALEYTGNVPPYFFSTAYTAQVNIYASSNLFAIYGITFFLIAWLTGKLAGRLHVTENQLSKTTLEYDRLSLLYKQIFDDISTGIITINDQNLITSFNNASERITGFSKHEVLGRPFDEFSQEITFTRENERTVCDFYKNDGTLIRLGYSCAQLNMPRQEDCTQAKWRVVTLQDISSIEQMERQVRESEKMAAIGEMSASIAHDLRNPLAAISGSAQILSLDQKQSDNHLPTTTGKLLKIIVRESERMAKTINDFLHFARPAPITYEWFTVQRLINELSQEKFSRQDSISPCTYQTIMDPRLQCWGDRQQVQEVLRQLIANAELNANEHRQFSVTIHASDLHRDGQPYTCIEVCDNGAGIEAAIKEKIFTPFFTTREDSTGLGLAIVKQIVDNHHGLIEVDTNHTFVTIFRVMFPNPPAAIHESD
ncbi:MAG: hypothetical protein CSA32_02000 [Desulfobulbus propionicus]|nr:MAG: hypothetical protein CSA32_02000 [Desulfobulbus propionicus]